MLDPALENASAVWGASMLRASVEGGFVIALVWALCRVWPQMSPSGRSWLWRAAFCKLLLALCWPHSIGIALLSSQAPRERAAHASASSASGIASRSNEVESSRELSFASTHFGAAPQKPTARGNAGERKGSFLRGVETGLVKRSAAPKAKAVAQPNHPPVRVVVLARTAPASVIWTEAALIFWLVGVGFLAMRSVRAWRWTRRLRGSGELHHDARLCAEVDDLRLRFGLARSPELLRCSGIEALALTGVFRPAILLPKAFALQATSEQAREMDSMMMAHELAHQKRRDLAWNWLLWAGQTLFWFHPLVWLGAREWRLAQEIACDALAVRASRTPLAQYGAMLVQTALARCGERREELFSIGVSARYATLHRRLAAMKHFTSKADKRALVLCAVLSSLLLIPWRLTSRSASAQTALENKAVARVQNSGAPRLAVRRAQNRQAVVSAQVQDPRGRPIRGATVIVMADLFGSRLLTGRTDASGQVSFQVAAPLGGSRLKCRATIYAPGWAFSGAGLEEGRAATVRLNRGTKIRGLVRDEKGHPVAGVGVSLGSVYNAITESSFSSLTLVPPAMRAALTTRTDARGHYELSGIPTDFNRAQLEIIEPRFIHRSFAVPLRSSARFAEVVAPVQTLQLASSIAGRVVDAKGAPLGGIEVIASGASGEVAGAEVLSAPDGTFRVGGLPPGRFKLMLRDARDKVVARPLLNIQVRPASLTRVPDLKMTPGGVVEGSVVDSETGKPIAGVVVSNADNRRLVIGSSPSKSQQQGRYRVRLPAGKGGITILGLPRGYLYPALGSPSRPLPVQVGEGQTLTLTIRLKKGATLRGVALNEQGRAPKDVLIVVTKVIPQWLLGWPDGEKSVRPDASGGWSLDSLSPGRYKIQVRGDWEIASAREVEVEVPFPAPVRLQLRSAPLPTLAGRVVTPAGRPVPGVSIGLNIDLPIGNDALAGSKEKLTTDALGRFARPRVRRDARLFLRASKKGYRFVSGGNISRVRTVQGTQFKVSDLVLAPANVGEMLRVGATITGRAIYSNGQPAQVKIQLEANGDLADSLRQTVDWRGQNNGGLLGRLSASVQTGADGQFKVSGLAALPYALFVTDQRAGWFWPAHWRATSFSVPPARGREVRMPDVVLERGAFVRFRVVDRETKEELQGEMRLTYLSKSRFGTEGGPTSTFAAPPQVPGKTVPAGTFTLGVWRNPDGRIVEGAAHMWTATNRYIRYYELASPTLEVSVNGGAHQKVRDGRVSFPVVAGQTYAVTYFLHRLRATDSGQN